MKKKLIVFHTESLYSRGGEKYLFEIFKRLSIAYEITLYLQAFSAEWKQKYLEQGIKVEKFWIPSRGYWFLLPLTLIVNYFRLRKKVERESIIFSTNFPTNFLAVLLSKKTITHCFEPLAIFYDNVVISSLPPFSKFCVLFARFFYSPLDHFAINESSQLTTLNNSVQKAIIKTYQRVPENFIPNGIDSQFFRPITSKKVSTKKYIIGHSTDYTLLKGTEDFLKIVKELKNYTENFEVRITESIQNKIKKEKYLEIIKEAGLQKKVIFLGTLSEKNLAKFYAELDVFCYTGSYLCPGGSTASLSVLEAQSCGTAVLRSIGTDDEIIDKKTGYYIKPEESKKAAKILSTFLELSENKKMEMRKASRKHILEHFSWDKSAEKLESIIKILK